MCSWREINVRLSIEHPVHGELVFTFAKWVTLHNCATPRGHEGGKSREGYQRFIVRLSRLLFSIWLYEFANWQWFSCSDPTIFRCCHVFWSGMDFLYEKTYRGPATNTSPPQTDNNCSLTANDPQIINELAIRDITNLWGFISDRDDKTPHAYTGWVLDVSRGNSGLVLSDPHLDSGHGSINHAPEK